MTDVQRACFFYSTRRKFLVDASEVLRAEHDGFLYQVQVDTPQAEMGGSFDRKLHRFLVYAVEGRRFEGASCFYCMLCEFEVDASLVKVTEIQGTSFYCLLRKFKVDAAQAERADIHGHGITFYYKPWGFKVDIMLRNRLEQPWQILTVMPPSSIQTVSISYSSVENFSEDSINTQARAGLPEIAQPMLDLTAAKAIGKRLAKPGWSYWYQVFILSLVRVDLTQIGRANSCEASLGRALEQIVPGTCAIMASAVCVEAQHRRQYEKAHKPGTFKCSVAHPTDIIGACYRHIIWRSDIGGYGRIWMPCHGADVSHVLSKAMEVGGFPTTTLTSGQPQGAPPRLNLTSWEVNDWDTPGKELTADRIMEVLDTRGPFIGTIWVDPWYSLFDSTVDNDPVYRSGCARDPVLQERCREQYFRGMNVGFHSVVVFEYRCGGAQIQVLDNHKANGPTRWVLSEELQFIHIVSVDTVDPAFHQLPSII